MGTSTGTEQQQCAFALYDSQALPLTELKNHIQAPCKPMYPDSLTRRPFPPSSVSSHPFWPSQLASSCLFMSSAAAHATAPCPVSADASPGGTHISSSPPPPHQPIFYSGPLVSACPPGECLPPLGLHTNMHLGMRVLPILTTRPRATAVSFSLAPPPVSPYLPQLSALCFSSHPAQRLPVSLWYTSS